MTGLAGRDYSALFITIHLQRAVLTARGIKFIEPAIAPKDHTVEDHLMMLYMT